PSSNQQPSISSIDDGDGSGDRKPKLKPLHWDKVRASSDREMVWDQLRSGGSTFTLDEEMIQTLFVVNAPKETTAAKWQVLPAPNPNPDSGNRRRRILDPKKSQNIAILLRALHLTADDVCQGLLGGNTGILGAEFLESLLKMAPTEEEERKLKESAGEGDPSDDAGERFLRAVLSIPFAFKRVEILLYISNFDSEAEYLKKSFATLQAACEELRSSRMFLKLLEAVLKTGNRMNVGTDRGDARAFKLDTLLKLVDVKGADGRTTLLHFVVQEIVRSEGGDDGDAKCRKLGLRVVAALSSELSNVKRAAAMDAGALTRDVAGLREGLRRVGEASGWWEEGSEFSGSVGRFATRAEEETAEIEAEESGAMGAVKEITEYFHGNSVLEEAHPFRIFDVVRDFLNVLDRVCEEFGSSLNDRSAVGSTRKFAVTVNPTMLDRV
ncbi:formin-like protein 1, partial [Genlisea aurea]